MKKYCLVLTKENEGASISSNLPFVSQVLFFGEAEKDRLAMISNEWINKNEQCNIIADAYCYELKEF